MNVSAHWERFLHQPHNRTGLMDSDIGREEGSHDGTQTKEGTDTSAAEAALKAKLSRKRTKTGCLTCRKRRIKCGEERPVCRNCIKSKRHCESYSQRVVFRQPTFGYHPTTSIGGAHIVFQVGPASVQATASQGVPNFTANSPAYTQLRPRPDGQLYGINGRLQQGIPVGQLQQRQQPSVRSPAGGNGHDYPTVQDQHGFVSATSQDVQPSAAQPWHPALAEPMPLHTNPGARPLDVPPDNDPPLSHLEHGKRSVFQYGQQLHNPDTPSMTLNDRLFPVMAAQIQQPVLQNSGTANALDHSWITSKQSPMVFPDQDSAVPIPIASHLSPCHQLLPASPRSGMPTTDIPHPELAQPTYYHSTQHSDTNRQSYLSTLTSQAFHDPSPEFYEHEEQPLSSLTPTALLNAAAVEALDDDYYDIGSEEEIDFEASAVHTDGNQEQRALSKILALNQIRIRELQIRRYDTFLYEGILDQYRVEEVANPLRNPATARVFAHFISATGPSLSIFERHPRNTSVLFTKGRVPLSQQGLWTYTMPMAALRHQGLLHAMLALASLHIARLQEASVTPSMQHYAWSLKRIHKAVGNPASRLKLTTIAASMLLGFYEVTSADHMKWNMHLAGSRQLFVETDFASMTSEVQRMKMNRAVSQSRRKEHMQYSPEEPSSRDDLLDQIPDIDERIISLFLGREVRYGDHGRIESHYAGIPTPLDLSKFEILKDLYWWYCKQDVYQSIVSGNKLLMDFSRWSNCPPRAPLGKIDAVYGTFDHLVLLLGRIADFSARDRVRKLKQMEISGGHWRPAPGMNIPRPPQSQTPSQTPSPPAMPTFYGMAPPPRSNVQMPSSYTPMYNSMPRPQNPPDAIENDLNAATNSALEEYGRIRAALHAFATSLGEAFEPLSSEYQEAVDTPFGTALFYRSYDIGCLWSIYNMAVIIAIRSHPHMPPASHMAAAVAAHETTFFANEIGRIAAGIVPGPADQPLNPSLGATLCESCMPSFFAAIQYTDARQRHETVARIFSIAKRTGWGSAELIANGCETAWVKAAAMGRGPPYQRIARPSHSDDPRLNGAWEKVDPNGMGEVKDERDRRLVKVSENARLNWAIGVMGVEDDVGSLAEMGKGTR